jgi:hypothetical protein|tara:strand:- start:50 stop:247 length:198 start_codon:yes stop_codon:yes gene_type:complete
MRDTTIYAQAVRRIEGLVNEFNDHDWTTDFANDQAILTEALNVIGKIEGTLYELTEILDHNEGYQ